jgi:hypothetical protein
MNFAILIVGTQGRRALVGRSSAENGGVLEFLVAAGKFIK